MATHSRTPTPDPTGAAVRRRPVAGGFVALAAVALLGGCGASASAAHHRALVTATGHGGPSTSPSGGAASSASGPGGQGAPGGAASGGVSGAAVVAASQALSRYLEALAQHDPAALAQSADGAPYAMAGILIDSAAINHDRGATTTVTVGRPSFSATASSPSAVTFAGSVTLTTAISGAEGSGTFDDTVAGPLTVRDEGGVWRVTGFTYDGRPLAEWTEHASQTVGGTNVTVGYVVSYGDVTAALVTLRQPSGSAHVKLQSCSLTPAGGAPAAGTGDFTAPPTPTGVLRFGRIDGTPAALALRFTTSTGQEEDFDLALS